VLGLAWYVAGCPLDKLRSLEEISEELVGLPWNIGAGLIALNDSELLTWSGLASALRDWEMMYALQGGITSRALVADLRKRLLAAGADPSYVDECYILRCAPAKPEPVDPARQMLEAMRDPPEAEHEPAPKALPFPRRVVGHLVHA
jgi:hypothetical protein